MAIHWYWFPDFCPSFKISKWESLIEVLISRLIVNENLISISMYENLSLGVDKQKQIKF